VDGLRMDSKASGFSLTDEDYERVKRMEEKHKPEYEKYLAEMDAKGLKHEAHGIHMWMLWTWKD
jgi:hypothetical protein